MNTHSAEYVEWQAACTAERHAWQNVQSGLAGEPLDAEAWARWLNSLKRETAALHALLDAQAQAAEPRHFARARQTRTERVV
jgi:gluconate kinase